MNDINKITEKIQELNRLSGDTRLYSIKLFGDGSGRVVYLGLDDNSNLGEINLFTFASLEGFFIKVKEYITNEI